MGSRPGSVMTAGPPMKKYGKLVLVDLAGSERLKVWLHMQQNPRNTNNDYNNNVMIVTMITLIVITTAMRITIVTIEVIRTITNTVSGS